MIAMKREVAARVAGFPWSECQVRKLTTSHCTSKNVRYSRKRRGSLRQQKNDSRSAAFFTDVAPSGDTSVGHTRESVQSPLVVLRT